jgi:hypothetical protein
MKTKELLRPSPEKVTRIRELNDAFRTTFCGGRVMMTSGIAAVPERPRIEIDVLPAETGIPIVVRSAA